MPALRRRDPVRRARRLRAEMPRLRARLSRLQRRRRAGGLPDLHRRRADRRPRHLARACRRAALVAARPALAALRHHPHHRPAAPRPRACCSRSNIRHRRARGPDRGRGMRRLPLLPTLVVAGAVAVMIGLGIWQLQRAAWKERLLAEYARRGGAPGRRSRSAARRRRPVPAALLPPRPRHLRRARRRARHPRRAERRRTSRARSMSSPAGPARRGWPGGSGSMPAGRTGRTRCGGCRWAASSPGGSARSRATAR